MCSSHVEPRPAFGQDSPMPRHGMPTSLTTLNSCLAKLHFGEFYFGECLTIRQIRQSFLLPKLPAIRYVCCAQTMDRDNPWIALLKVWIRALRNNPWIVCSIYGSRKRGTRSMDLGQTIDAWKHVRSGGLEPLTYQRNH